MKIGLNNYQLETILIVSVAFWVSGCGDFFERTTTELESKAVIRDISRVRENPYIRNPIPSEYLAEPERLVVEDGVKLFYFTKYQAVGDLTYVNPNDPGLQKQMNGYGGTVRDLGFKVSTNPSTNQLIVHCADDAECDQVLAYLKQTDVPPIQVHIDCLILERFGDVTKDWESTLLVENFLGEEITLGESKYPNPAFPGAALRESRRREFGLDFGYWMNQGVSGHQVRAVVDMLESRGYLKILLNPTLDTVNGKRATVKIVDTAPIEKTVNEAGGSVSYTVTDYTDVSDTLSIVPFVYADGSIGLQTDIRIGSKSKPEGVVQTPIITERSINVEENRIEPGKSLVIGGMRKAENRSVVRGVPFFKDLPLVGILFSSKDFEENATEIVFILTPSVSPGSVPYQEMADMIRDKFKTPVHNSDFDMIMTDPLGSDTYSQVVSKEADQAETEIVRLQVEAAEARRQAQAEQLRAEKALLEAEAMRARSQEMQAMLDKATAAQKASLAERQAMEKESQVRQAQISQKQEAIRKAQAEAEAARAEAQKAHAALKAAEEKVKSFNQQEQQAQQKAREIQQRIDELQKQSTTEETPEAQSQPESPEQE